MSSSVEIRTLTTPQELFAAAAEEVVRAANEAVAQRGRFTIALAGGSTPKSLYNLLATNARTALPWDRMFFFWGDERHVPPTDPDSNYRMADETMLSKIPVPTANVFRMKTENPDAAAVAEDYEQTLRKFFQVLGDVEQIVEKLVDVFRVHVERLVDLPGQFGQGLQCAPEFGNGLANFWLRLTDC